MKACFSLAAALLIIGFVALLNLFQKRKSPRQANNGL
jgi:hypothetical protein